MLKHLVPVYSETCLHKSLLGTLGQEGVAHVDSYVVKVAPSRFDHTIQQPLNCAIDTQDLLIDVRGPQAMPDLADKEQLLR